MRRIVLAGLVALSALPFLRAEEQPTATWSGVYTELVEISDNLFTATSGAQLVETAPQNSAVDGSPHWTNT